MKTTDDRRPADTTMMRIVHDALRRDLRRARATLAATPAPGARQLAAIRRHLLWMVDFLEAHHRSEDDGLYPLLRERDPGAVAVLDGMHADHAAVATAVEELRRSASDAASHGTHALAAAIARLADVLVPHLEREEQLAMPLVSASITHAEWSDIEQRHNLDGKSMRQLGREGHWLIDDATAEDRQTVLHLVSPPAQIALLYGFGPAYRRTKRACWTPQRRIAHDGGTSVVVDADIDSVWRVIKDPTRVGEWSHECIEGRWIDGATEAVPGARFRGRNRNGVFRWGRQCEVIAAAPYTLTWRTVPTTLYPDSTEWTLRLEPAPSGGTTIEQTFHVVKGTALEPLYALLVSSHRERTDALTRDLQRIGRLARSAGAV